MTTNNKEKKVSQTALDIINEYAELDLGKGIKVKCPYFKNYKKNSGMKLRSLSGKGTPEEIVMETKIHAHLSGFSWQTASRKEIRKFMEKRDIGIDCSGFIVWIFYFWFKKDYGINFFSNTRKQFRDKFLKWIRILLRPSQNIDANDLTSNRLALRITDFQDVEPGDIIRSRKGKHVIFITKVLYSPEGKVKRIHYVHSTPSYGKDNGIHEGEILTVADSADLKKQWWKEQDKNQKNWTYEGFLKDDGYNGIYRLRLLNKTAI